VYGVENLSYDCYWKYSDSNKDDSYFEENNLLMSIDEKELMQKKYPEILKYVEKMKERHNNKKLSNNTKN